VQKASPGSEQVLRDPGPFRPWLLDLAGRPQQNAQTPLPNRAAATASDVGIPTGPVRSDCAGPPGSCRSFESSEALGSARVEAEVCIGSTESVYRDQFVVWEADDRGCFSDGPPPRFVELLARAM
jgi:hypothetical protein